MSLQFIIGNSGAGKSYYAYKRIIEDSLKHPEKNYYVIVPEQFTMQTQKALVEMHPGKGILNIDILSFERLAYRVFEETGGGNRKVLEDTGKSMVLQKMVQQHRKELDYLGSQMNKPGYLDEVKSLVSEFMQYDIKEDDLEEMKEKAKDQALLEMKLKDVGVLYQSFKEFLKGHYMTGEEVMDVLLKQLPFSKKLKGAELLFDGFTGFTPIQVNVIRELLVIADRVCVTVTMDEREDAFTPGKPHQLFFMSKQMIRTLAGLTKNLDDPVYLKLSGKSRFSQAPAMQFLEKNIFRYRKGTYEKEQQEIQIFAAASPLEEMREAARRMAQLVRTCGYRYGEIAVITGNLEEYARLASQVFEEADIPYFIDEKHSVLMNPFVEYLRAAMEMAVQGFPYESVFRYLRCGMSEVTREQADKLENYVLALGIRGYRKWSEKWVRVYRGMEADQIQELNEIREVFAEEVKGLADGFCTGKKTVEEYCRILYEFILKSNVWQKLKKQEQNFKDTGDKAMEKEYNQIYGIVMDLLDKMVEILGNETVSRQEFRQLLETGLSQAKVALIPPSIDQVMVGDMERSRLKDIKALFFVGVNEGNIPKSTQTGGILSELDRDFFKEQGVELAPGPKELMNMQRFYLYLNMTKPREQLILSFSDTNAKGEGISPAYLIGSIRGLYPKLEIERAGESGAARSSVSGAGMKNETGSGNGEYCYPENPEAGISLFLEKLAGETGKDHEILDQTDAMFGELYSWYLRDSKYHDKVQKLVQSAFAGKPKDIISQSVAKALYGEISPYSATRLERFAACAFAHFLQYGMKLTERVEYEFKAMDMGNVMHEALESFAEEVRKRGLKWTELTEQERNEIADECLNNIVADYGNTVLKSSARNEYMIERTRRILRRTVWALQKQLEQGEFQPEGFEVTFGGGRIDRVDIMEDQNKVYVKVIDYKTGNTSFDLVYLYHGLQLQLMIYLDGALKVEQKKYPDKEIVPAGVFYYNIKDPMIQEKIDADVEAVSAGLMKELKMNGLVQADAELVRRMDNSLGSIPVAFNKDGSFRKNSSVADRAQFTVLGRYVRTKIEKIRSSILEGDARVSPYELGKKNACTYCPYMTVCGFDRKLSGYEFRRLKNFSDEELWKAFDREAE
ncbi:helicase-exonuclease AddAB subunit AddB [Blautia luti]|uniref:helicase-exonuclease AddAB subunit AddB n=1 Tax=Blautia luti TaxID=89014 RepID=UPI0018ABBF42|nr:helicase-exonuclease AddAB subunit AddB [Blautia luti]